MLFLDEPTTGCDVEARRRFWAAVRAFATAGRAVVFATHYLEEGDAVADRIVVIRGGRIVGDGTAAEIKALSDGRHVRFRLPGAGADPSARAALAALPGVTSVAIEGDLVRLRSADSDATARGAFEARLPLRGLEIGGADPEEACLALVDGSAVPEEAPA